MVLLDSSSFPRISPGQMHHQQKQQQKSLFFFNNALCSSQRIWRWLSSKAPIISGSRPLMARSPHLEDGFHKAHTLMSFPAFQWVHLQGACSIAVTENYVSYNLKTHKHPAEWPPDLIVPASVGAESEPQEIAHLQLPILA